MNKTIKITDSKLYIQNSHGVNRQLTVDLVSGIIIITVVEDKKTVTYSCDTYEIGCLKEFLK